MTATFAVATKASSAKERLLINRATVNPTPARMPTPAIPGHVKPSAIPAIFDCTARKENAVIPTAFPKTRPRRIPRAIGLEIANFNFSVDKFTPALANANNGRTR